MERRRCQRKSITFTHTRKETLSQHSFQWDTYAYVDKARETNRLTELTQRQTKESKEKQILIIVGAQKPQLENNYNIFL